MSECCHGYDKPPGPHGESTGGRCIFCGKLDPGIEGRIAAAEKRQRELEAEFGRFAREP